MIEKSRIRTFLQADYDHYEERVYLLKQEALQEADDLKRHNLRERILILQNLMKKLEGQMQGLVE